jgi:hypothetical protein
MKNLVLLFVLFFVLLNLSAADLVVEGTYQNKNLYVSNPTSADGVGFCAFEVTVNGVITTDEVNASTFEVDFSALSLSFGQPVVIVIKHKDGCEPTVANPSVLQPVSTFECTKISLNDQGNLSWSTSGERIAINFLIEQFKWNKWVKMGEVPGVGVTQTGTNDYSFKVNLVAGENKYRVSQQSFDGAIRSSQSATISSSAPVVTFERDSKEMMFKFSSKTSFEIVDMYGDTKVTGNAEKASFSKLIKGEYFLNYDNSSVPFSIK